MTARAAKESAVRSSCPDVIISGPCSLFQLADRKVRIYSLLRDVLIWELSSVVAPLFRCTIFVIVHLNLPSHLPTILSPTVEAAYGPKEGAGVTMARHKWISLMDFGITVKPWCRSVVAQANEYRPRLITLADVLNQYPCGLAKTVATRNSLSPSPLTAIAIIHFDE